MFEVHLTKQQRENLDKLATYLENLPADYSAFNMAHYFITDGITSEKEFAEIEAKYARENGGVGKCGAVACAVGHGPSAGVLFDEFDFSPTIGRYRTADWTTYVEKFCTNGSPEWEFMFGGGWAYHDNTPQGAAKRIRYTLANYTVSYRLGCYQEMIPVYEAFHTLSRTS